MEVTRSKERITDTGSYYRKEKDRVAAALEDAKRRLSMLEGGIITPQSMAKKAELTVAIRVGNLYLEALKKKVG